MGDVEKRSAKRRKKADLQRMILGAAATTGVIAIAIVAPNVLGALSKLGLVPSSRQKETIRRSWQRCVTLGLLRREDDQLVLTEKGERLLNILTYKDIARRATKWDERWRVLIFDISERRKHIRERIREMLRGFGFAHLQDSVWIIPYDCEDIVTLLKEEYHVRNEMKYMVVESIDDDEKLRKKFGL